jgi:hypothetical protein
MIVGCCCNSAHRASCTSSRSSMVAKCRLISTELVSGHRCSAGCNSGEYGGKKSKWRCSGTRRRALVCQPARSSTRTICLRGLAPTASAKAASSISKSAMLVGRPQLNLGVGKGGGHWPQQRPYVFLKASCCAASANVWRGRGRSGTGVRVQPRSDGGGDGCVLACRHSTTSHADSVSLLEGCPLSPSSVASRDGSARQPTAPPREPTVP